jgi:hypothetical protein
MNLIEALDGPFKAWLGDSDWRPWRAFLKVLSAVPLDPDERDLFHRCTGRTATFDAPVSEAWVVVGRRGRKSAIAAVIGVHAAVFRDWRSVLAPGETGRVLIVAVTKDQARIVRSYCEAILRSHPDLEALIEATDQESITLTNGLAIQCVANSFRSIRGPAVVCAVFEELAFWRSDESANPDKEVLRAVRPSMLTTRKRGALLIGISSPYAKRGLLYEKHRDHYGDDESRVLIWQADTLTMNPAADTDEIAAAYADDPQAAAAEFGAQFRDDLQSFLDADLLAKLTRGSPLELPPRAGITYRGFVDPSGGRGDAMTVAIAHREEDGRNVLDVVRATQAPFDPAVVVADYAALLKEYRIGEATGDAYSGEWCAAAFQEHGVTYKTSAIPKSAIYLEALPLFTRAEVELPDHRGLLTELASLERRTARGGKDSVDHPPRGHDDMANAVAGALVLASRPAKRAVGAWLPGGATATADRRHEAMERAGVWRDDDGGAGNPESVDVHHMPWAAVAETEPVEDADAERDREQSAAYWSALARGRPVGKRWDWKRSCWA